jgi:hypothetical protein
VVLAAEYHKHDALHDEQQAEGGEDRVTLQHVAIASAAHERRQQHLVDRPVEGKGSGDN